MLSFIWLLSWYLLQSIALQTIARRRGIKCAWLAWVPIASLWVLGAIADDFKKRTGGTHSGMRFWLPSLMVTLLVLMGIVVSCLFDGRLLVLEKAISQEEFQEYYNAVNSGHQDLYSESPEEVMERMIKQVEEKLTDEEMLGLAEVVQVISELSLLVVGVALTLLVLQFVCQYRLYSSCDPNYKVLFLVVSIVLSFAINTAPVFMFLCRDKDLGMPLPARPELPGGEPTEDPWQPPSE